MATVNLLSEAPWPRDRFVDSSLISRPWTPSPQASIISLRNNGWTISDRFESLLKAGGPKAVFETPVRFFSSTPFQHLQMAFSLLGFLRAQNPWGLVSTPLGQQIYLRSPIFQRILQNLSQGLTLPSSVIPPSSILPPSSTRPVTDATNPSQTSDLLESVKTQLQHRIYTPDAQTQQCLTEINSKRAQQGKAPIDFLGTTKKVEDIMNDPALSDKEKKKRIGDLRNELGLSKKDMKRLFTKRLAKIYQEAANQLKTHLSQLKESVKEAERVFGKDSPQAAAARGRLQAAQSHLEPTLKKWEHQASLYKSMFPSFWSKIGGFFKKIGQGLLKIGQVFSKIMNFVSPFLRFIPGIGQMVAFGWGALKGLVQAIKGNWRGFLGGLLSFAKGIPGVGTALSAVSSLGSKILPLARGVWEATQGNLSSLLQWGGSLLYKIPGVAPFLSKTSEYLSYLISPLRPKTDPLQEGMPPGALS